MTRESQLPIDQLLAEMQRRMQDYQDRNPLLVAILAGGLWIGEHLRATCGIEEPLGALDISFYRDDFSRIGLNPEVKASTLPVPIDSRHIILIDDVLYTGRTVRAAMNELFAWGRPSSVTLAVLLDRGGRELPVQADIVGYNMSLDSSLSVKVAADGMLTYSEITGA